ncbi:MAG: preprotein translocase subunit SecG [Alphaproteobacteria bacterium]|nr:preprotein translocase subunit SecG [Alphaproteobacteria bacterium]
MTTVLLMIHLLLALALVGVVLIQRSEGGGLGIGGGGGGMGGLMSGRGTANLLTRTTAVLAACFMASSMLLAYVSAQDVAPESILEELDKSAEEGEFTDLQTELPMGETETMPESETESETETPSVPVDQ